MHLSLFTLLSFNFLASISQTAIMPAIPKRELTEYYHKPGNFVIGALFSFHRGASNEPLCSNEISDVHLQWSETVMFVIEQINIRTDLLPNHTLGFYIRDDCGSEDGALWSTLAITQNEASRNQSENTGAGDGGYGKVVGIVGPSNSVLSLYAAKAAALYELPLISSYGSSDELGDRDRFPFFYRAVPPDRFQVEVILDLLVEFDWVYSALIFSADTYGINGGTDLISQAADRDICFAFTDNLPAQPTASQLAEVVSKIYKLEKLSAVVMFATGQLVTNILESVLAANLNKRIVWIGTDAWPISTLLSDLALASLITDSLMIRQYSTTVPNLREYLLTGSLDEVSPWMDEYVQSHPACTTNKFDCLQPDSLEHNQVAHTVYAFGYALHAYAESLCSDSLSCQIDGYLLKSYLQNVSFDVGMGNFRFESNQEPAGRYLIEQVQYHDQRYSAVNAGEWKQTESNHRGEMTLDLSILQWLGTGGFPPTSDCREKCQPGYISKALTLKCCMGCTACQANEIVVNGTECSACPSNKWPDGTTATVCEDAVTVGVSWSNPIIITSVVFTSIGLVLSTLVAAGLVYYRDEPLVKASSRELSAVNVFGVVLTFATIFPLSAGPTIVTCSISEIMIGVSMAAIFATTFLKANRIYRVFNASRKTTSKLSMTSPRDQLALALVLIGIQVVIVIVLTLVNPTAPSSTQWPKWELFCPISTNVIIAGSYSLVLIVLCCVFAFKVRRVPDSYNESKFIAASVYTTVLVFIVAVLVYVTADETLLKIAAFSFAFILNGYLVIAFSYVPRLYGVVVSTVLTKDNPGGKSSSDAQDDLRFFKGRSSKVAPTVCSVSRTDHNF